MKLPKSVREFFRKTGAQGGAAKSEAKAQAARENGKKGGRPKKKTDKRRVELHNLK